LHISPEKQEEKIKERLVLEHKFWKFDPSDVQARQKRDQYQEVYEKIFDECTQTPRHIIPADQKWYKNYLIAKTIVQAFEKEMKLERPDLDEGEELYKEMYAEQDKQIQLIKSQKIEDFKKNQEEKKEKVKKK